jgi:hypothetical protein
MAASDVQSLAEALRTGPFERALGAAIRHRGLSLERLHARLSERGVPVSLASLSYWQRGRSRPEREHSLRAVRELEAILGVPPESLVSLLGPRRPRGRWVGQRPKPDQLTWLSRHELVTIDRGSDLRLICTRGVIRAQSDGVGRHVVVHQAPPGAVPAVRRALSCRPGRVCLEAGGVGGGGLVTVELIFDRPLATGETRLIEYLLDFGGEPDRLALHHRGFPVAARDYVLAVQFDRTTVPARCYRTWAPDPGAVARDVRELRPTDDAAVHFVELDVAPGVHGVRWEWA